MHLVFVNKNTEGDATSSENCRGIILSPLILVNYLNH